MDIKITVREVAGLINGKVEGNPEAILHSFFKLEGAVSGQISFLSNPSYEQHIYNTGATAVIVSTLFNPSQPITTTLIRVENPYAAVAVLLEKFNTCKHPQPGIHPMSFIDESATLGKEISVGAFSVLSKNAKTGNNVIIYPQVYVGENCVIGNDTILYPGVKLLTGCIVGNNCTIHAGCVIGSDGFGFAPTETENYKKVPQTGNVVIEDYVEIGANTAIDRATLGSTIIHKGVKLDNLIQIAHNVEVGNNTVVAAQCGISGSTKVGKNCMIGGQAGIVGHIRIADGVKIAAQSGVAGNILKKNLIIQGSPSFEIKKYRRSYVSFKKLPEIYSKVLELEKRLKNLENPNK